ncbi:distal membrane-arm assembly complex protein 1 [Gadus macrocephalus]|uniref:distal membrane-arm assembly complex protein 1 n=1 Tax=Gadus macrocephalus TaxID=80720 RepID=UPI0028CB4B19|nr:distal membrane-arm assembly complex protein 1 [Gadus macrocephalus]
MSTVAEPAPTAGSAAVSSPGERDPSPRERFQSCWSCRLLSGGGLIAGGLYVFRAAKSVMRTGAPPTIGLAMQLTFAASLGAWGIVVIADPVGKAQKSSTDE